MPGTGEKITKETAEKLKALKDVALSGNAANFIAENNEKLERWGTDMYFSAKQTNWVNSLYDEHVGHDEPETEDELNDEVPY